MMSALPQRMLEKGDRVHGFSVSQVTPLGDLQLVAYELSHEKSGARVLHLHGEDRENLFAIALATPPPDNTGLPHILEHTVLCGSRKYPVKDPFVELLKTSLATFLNAMTYPDKTVYPCASMNERDFFNIADVYCDAVFNPLLSKIHFMQEGYHLEFADPEDPDSPLVIKGIVYNEMKGAYSDLDTLIQRHVRMSLFPDNAYGLDSGGDPEVLPSLTYERFVEFHRTYYHPANSRIFLYGHIPTERHLEFLDRNYLSGYGRIAIDTSIKEQPKWGEPRRKTVVYPLGRSQEPARKAAVVLAFFTNQVTDQLRSLCMHVLDSYLLDNAASPLRKALIDSGLGEELTESGYSSDQRDAFFTVGLKGTEPEHTDAIADLVRATCGEVVRKGLERKKLEAAFHRLELSCREIRPMYPLQLMHRAYSGWLYGMDPVLAIRLSEQLAELRTRYEADPMFFERALDEMIVQNPHYTVLTFVPDKEYLLEKERALRRELEVRKASLGPGQREALLEEAREIAAIQCAPNPPEARASLPRLSLEDVDQEPAELATTAEEVCGRPLLWTDMFSNGVSYIAVAFDLRGIDDDLVDYLPLFADALRKMGAAGLSYEEMAEREALASGGVDTSIAWGGTVEDCRAFEPYLVVTANSLDPKLPDMLGVVSDRLLALDLSDRDRLEDVILQGRMHRASDIVPRGNAYAALYAARHLNANCAFAERVAGITQVRTYDRLARIFDRDHEGIVRRLERIGEFLAARERVTVSCLTGERGRGVVEGWMEKLLGGMAGARSEPEPTGALEVDAGARPRREGVAAATEVSFAATVVPAVAAAHTAAPAVLLLSVSLSFGYLWDEIRVRRGAYGARAEYHWPTGVLSLTSYRDPCIKETLETFEKVVQHAAEEMDLSETAVEQAIIGTIKVLDPPIRPPQAVGVALRRYLRRETPRFRSEFRKRLLSLRGDDIRRVAREIVAPSSRNACVCVLASRERLDAANALLKEAALSISDL
jgi:Zn-dependent M16 (insulinase) family peptidase